MCGARAADDAAGGRVARRVGREDQDRAAPRTGRRCTRRTPRRRTWYRPARPPGRPGRRAGSSRRPGRPRPAADRRWHRLSKRRTPPGYPPPPGISDSPFDHDVEVAAAVELDRARRVEQGVGAAEVHHRRHVAARVRRVRQHVVARCPSWRTKSVPSGAVADVDRIAQQRRLPMRLRARLADDCLRRDVAVGLPVEDLDHVLGADAERHVEVPEGDGHRHVDAALLGGDRDRARAAADRRDDEGVDLVAGLEVAVAALRGLGDRGAGGIGADRGGMVAVDVAHGDGLRGRGADRRERERSGRCADHLVGADRARRAVAGGGQGARSAARSTTCRRRRCTPRARAGPDRPRTGEATSRETQLPKDVEKKRCTLARA